MFLKEDIDNMPWQIIESVVFGDMEFAINFKSGNGIKAKAPDKATYDEFKRECLKNLHKSKVFL